MQHPTGPCRTIDLFLRGLKLVFVIKGMGQTNEQQRYFNEWQIIELHVEVDFIQTSLKLLFTLQQYWNVVCDFQLSFYV
jgi:hypothetical protein